MTLQALSHARVTHLWSLRSPLQVFGVQLPRSAWLIRPYIRDRKILQGDLGHQPPQTNTHPRPSPRSSSPRILSRGFGRIRLFLEPSGGAFDKRALPWQSPLGIGPADLGQLWLVAYTGSQPLGICQTDSHPTTPLPIPCIPTAPASSLCCSPKQTDITFLSLACPVTARVSTQLWP